MLSFLERKQLVARYTLEGFYRKHFEHTGSVGIDIANEDMWRALPPVTKDDFLRVPLHERTYIPIASLDHLRASSGTSGKEVLFSPRTHVRGMTYRNAYHDFEGAFLAFTVPMMPHWHELYMLENGKKPRVIVYDPKNPYASIRLARLAGVTGISAFVYHYRSICEHMKAEGMHERIKLVEITGEVCTHAQYEHIRNTFPNAIILQSYNSSEVEDAHVGIPCRPIDGSDPIAVYQPKDTHYLEIIDSDGSVIDPTEGAEGDLLITAYPGDPSAMPLIRYRIGDTIRIVESVSAHRSFSFTVLGRTEMDFLKIVGGVLRADEIARVLRDFPDDVTDVFELHCNEQLTDDGALLRVTVHVDPRRDIDFVSFAEMIAKRIRVSPTHTYADGVALKRYLPLECRPLMLKTGQKIRRIVRE